MSETLMISVSGVRGLVGVDLTPEFVARWAAAFGMLVRDAGGRTVVMGRDARTSGLMFAGAAQAGLASVGCRVVDCGVVPTPTVQLAVEHHQAGGGIVITASHNPVEWNAMKFVGADGLFLDPAAAATLRARAEGDGIARAGWDAIGGVDADPGAVRRHVAAVLALPVVDADAIRARRFTVALDAVRGAGGAIMTELLTALGCRVEGMDLEPDGRFPRPPEPVPANLGGLGDLVRRTGANIGMAVDPDVDRLALVDGTGRPIGEDWTLALAVETVLDRGVGPVVVNLSTSLVVDDAARRFGVRPTRAPVGEANVARAMQAAGAAIGGEGNGGVMYGPLHLGRDAPLAAALVLDLLARGTGDLAQCVAARPAYAIVKAKAERGPALEPAYARLAGAFGDAEADWQDGLRLGWPDRWVHLRPSGTEPIVRIIAEAPTAADADRLVAAARGALAASTSA